MGYAPLTAPGELPTCAAPTDPASFYIYVLFRAWCYGPFPDEVALTDAALRLDTADPYWDYDGAAFLRGVPDDPARPVPMDRVPAVPREMRERIQARRKAA